MVLFMSCKLSSYNYDFYKSSAHRSANTGIHVSITATIIACWYFLPLVWICLSVYLYVCHPSSTSQYNLVTAWILLCLFCPPAVNYSPAILCMPLSVLVMWNERVILLRTSQRYKYMYSILPWSIFSRLPSVLPHSLPGSLIAGYEPSAHLCDMSTLGTVLLRSSKSIPIHTCLTLLL